MTTATTVIKESKASELSLWKGAMLVAGTCIGGGMLVMPIQTADAGFCIASLVLAASWVFMSFTSLLLVEATLWFKNRSHFSTIAQALLGTPGKLLSIAIYLFMNTASLVAYTSGGAMLIDDWIKSIFSLSLGYPVCCVLFTLIFGGIVSFGVALIGRINNVFVLLMAIAYCYLVGLGISSLESDYLAFRPAWIEGLGCFPLIFTAFSHQMIVPSLCSYLNYDSDKLRKSILLGTTMPFLIYFLWLLVIHGLIPFEGENGLHAAFVNNSLIVEPFKARLFSPILLLTVDAFAFLALVTSYFGLSIALLDFVRDLLKGIGKELGKWQVTLLSIVPCLILAMLFEKALLACLDISGGFGDALLSGMIPVAMVWIGRYQKGYTSQYQVAGGKLALIGAGLFGFFIFVIQWVKLFW